MSGSEKKERAKAPAAERGWHVSFSVTRPEGGDAVPWRRRLTPLDLALLAAGLALFLVEPFALHMLLTHYKVSLAAQKCVPSQQVVVVHSQADGAPGEQAVGQTAEQGSDVITPLLDRDPSSLVMGPGR